MDEDSFQEQRPGMNRNSSYMNRIMDEGLQDAEDRGPGKLLEIYTLLGTFITVLGFVVQVVGIRGSHYLVVSQIIRCCYQLLTICRVFLIWQQP